MLIGDYLTKRIAGVAVVIACALGAPATAPAQHLKHEPGFHMVTAQAAYRPVTQPGTQRRVAQTDAENKARKDIYEYVGGLRLRDGRTVNDVLARDAKLKARLLDVIRRAEVVDWAVNPACACVQVWMRLDMKMVSAVLAACGYYF